MSKIMFKLNKKYLAIFAICMAIIVVSLNSDYSFIIDFVGSIGVPKAFADLDKTIEEINQ